LRLSFSFRDIGTVTESGQRPDAPARLWSLDVLRAVCAGVVCLSHWYLWSDFAPENTVERAVHTVGKFLHDSVTVLTWPTGGHHPAVIAFFVLSGFCIHYPCERRVLDGRPEIDWRSYYLRRFQRIMPVYWAACLLGFIFVSVEALRPSGSPLLGLHAISSFEDFMVRFFAIAGLYPREIFAGNYILTTVTVEILMYAAYPGFYRFAVRGQWSGLGLVFLLLHALAIALLGVFTPYWVYNSVFMLGIFWYGGALAAHLFLSGRGRVAGKWVFLTWLGFLGLKAMPYFVGLSLLKQAAWGLICVLGLLWFLGVETIRGNFSQSIIVRSFRPIAGVSYSLYAMHTPAIMLATWALVQMGIRNYMLQLSATLITSVVATLIVHFGVERIFYKPRSEVSRAGSTGNSDR
jgi:peptidoglycan/LPS O-acetylase OafA/YrhL